MSDVAPKMRTLPKIKVVTVRGKMHETDGADYRLYIDGEDAGWAIKHRSDKRTQGAPEIELFLRVHTGLEHQTYLIVGALRNKFNMEKLGYVPIYIVKEIV